MALGDAFTPVNVQESGRAAYTAGDGRKIQVVTGMGILFSDDFGGTQLDDVNRWQVIDGGYAGIGSGTNMGNGVNTHANSAITAYTASSITVTMGTVLNAELWLISQQIFAGSEDITIILKASQSIANNRFFVGLVEVDPSTGNPIANAGGAANEFSNRGGVNFLTATGTVVNLEAMGDSSSAAATVPSGTLGTLVNTLQEYTIEIRPEDIQVSQIQPDTTGARNANSPRLSSQVPNDTKAYKLLLQWKNTGTPGSSTTVTINRIVVSDNFELRAEVVSGRGDQVGVKSVAVNVTGSGATAAQVQGSTPSGSSQTGNPFLGGAIGLSSVGAVTSNGKLAGLISDISGRLIVRPFGAPTTQQTGRQVITATTETTLITAVPLQRCELTHLDIANRDNVAHTVDLRDTTAGAVRATYIIPAGQTYSVDWASGFAAAAVNTNWTVQLREAATTAVEISATGNNTSA